eukprot:g23766.t1
MQAYIARSRPIRDLPAESPREAGASAGAPLRGLQLRDGAGRLEFLVEASPSALPEATQVGLFIGLFSASHTNSEAKVEEWMVAGGTWAPSVGGRHGHHAFCG